MPHLEKAAKNFNDWMVRYVNVPQKFVHYTDDNQALIGYLGFDWGFQYIKTYQEFCELAKLVQSYGYHTSTPPCSAIQFGKAIYIAQKNGSNAFGDEKPVMHISAQIYEAAEQFVKWMKRYHKNSDSNEHNQFLLDGINFKLIKTYEQFCLLAEVVQDEGYNTSNPPCTPVQFGHAVRCSELTSEIYGFEKPVLPEGISRLYLHADDFDLFMKGEQKHPASGNDNEALLKWYSSYGKDYVKDYEEFCAIAREVQRFGYATLPLPCSLHYFNAVKDPLIHTKISLEEAITIPEYSPELILLLTILKNIYKAKQPSGSYAYPAVLKNLGVLPNKATGPRVLDALKKMAATPNYTPGDVSLAAQKFLLWSEKKNRHFHTKNMQEIKKISNP